MLKVACGIGKSEEHNGRQAGRRERSRQGDYFVVFGTMIKEYVSD
jgi:hypothetical protein